MASQLEPCVYAHIQNGALLIVHIWKLKQALKTLFRVSNRDLLRFLGNARLSGAACYMPT